MLYSSILTEEKNALRAEIYNEAKKNYKSPIIMILRLATRLPSFHKLPKQTQLKNCSKAAELVMAGHEFPDLSVLYQQWKQKNTENLVQSLVDVYMAHPLGFFHSTLNHSLDAAQNMGKMEPLTKSGLTFFRSGMPRFPASIAISCFIIWMTFSTPSWP